MLTRQGWLVAVGAVVLVGAGRVLALPELFALGAVAGALLLACVLMVHLSRLDLQVGRTVHPARVHVGTPARVELYVRNRRTVRTPVLRLHDPVTGTRGADLLVPPLLPGDDTVAAYRLPTARRGMLEIGPLEVVVSDPFGLVELAAPAAPRTELVVYPRIEQLRPLPYTTGHDPQAGVRRRNSLARTGEDFYALRHYVVGDDLRRVHWPSTARHGDLMVRQNELPWQGRTTVLLDVRRSANPGDALERCVSCAGSVVAAAAKRQDLVRLVSTDGGDTGFGTGFSHVEAIYEYLAVVSASAGANLRRAVEALGRRPSGGALAVVIAEVPEHDLRALAGLRTRFGSFTVVQVDRSAWDPGAPVGPASPLGAPGLVRVTRDAPLPVGWEAHLARLGARRSTSAGARR